MNMRSNSTRIIILAAAALLMASVLPAQTPRVHLVPFQATTHLRVTVYNLTPGQPFSPPVVVSHSEDTSLFDVGMPASDGLAMVAESGNPSTLMAELMMNSEVHDMQVGGDSPFFVGESRTVEIEAPWNAAYISIVGMLGSTNDTFYGLHNLRVWPLYNRQEIYIPAYDAGSEYNSEDCDFVPGPPCGGSMHDPTEAEGRVTVSNGIHGIGDLDATLLDWRNPVAKIVIEPAN